jgi:hypothetical protein
LPCRTELEPQPDASRSSTERFFGHATAGRVSVILRSFDFLFLHFTPLDLVLTSIFFGFTSLLAPWLFGTWLHRLNNRADCPCAPSLPYLICLPSDLHALLESC